MFCICSPPRLKYREPGGAVSNDAEIARVFMLAKARVVRGTRGRPIRTIVEQGHRKPVGKFASLKSGRAMPWASFAELYLMWISEADTAVRRFLSQPFRLELLVGQRTRP